MAFLLSKYNEIDMKIIITHDPDQLATRGNNAGAINTYHNLVTMSISAALTQLNHEVEIYGADLDLVSNLLLYKPDLVFNTSIRGICDSEYGYAADILEKLKIPFTGPSAISCNNAFDKQRSLSLLRKSGLKTPRSITFDMTDEIIVPHSFEYPLFVKPRRGGCSWGITEQSIIYSEIKAVEQIRHALESIGEPAIVEEFLSGREFTVGILGNQPSNIFKILEFYYKDGELPFRSQSRKMSINELEESVGQAELNVPDRLAIENLALKAYKTLGCRDYARIDIRMDKKGIPTLLEVNAIPNLDPETSSFGLMAKYAGITFIDLIGMILKFALTRYSK